MTEREKKRLLQQKELDQLLTPLRSDRRVQQMKKFTQHGVISTFDHCESVARMSYKMDRFFHLGSNLQELTRAAFLHDYYLYDWHTFGDKLHGFHHPARAAECADRDFQLSEKEKAIILSHMWPLNIATLPGSREALIVCIADKICSTSETLFHRA